MIRSALMVENEQELARVLKRRQEELSCTVKLALAGSCSWRLVLAMLD